ncbi:retrovirus-related pol polyprotein from transposon TNT 1-94 [Tanacetum coccineum]
MSHLLAQFISLNLNSSKSIVATNDDSMPLPGIGSVDIQFIALSDVYYIPALTMNLASVSKICDSGCDVNFSVSDCSIYDRKTHELVGTGHRQKDLYVLDRLRDIHDTASSSVDLSSFWLSPLGKLDAHDISDCSGCKLAKFSALPFGNSVSFSNAPFDLVYSDVWGPSPVSTKGDLLYEHSSTNSVVERKHRHLVKTARSFLLPADVPSVFCREAVLTATYVINKISTAHNSGLSPFEKLYETLPDYSSLRVIGCTCFVLKPHVFLEHLSYYSVPASSHNLTQSELIKIDPFEEPTPVVSPIIPEPVFETTSEQTTTEIPSVADTPPQSTTTTETPPITILEATSTGYNPSITITKSPPEFVAVPPTNGAMAEELTTLHQTHTWDLVPFPLGKRAIGSRWVYKIKTKSGGSIERYKARLVVKGYSQEYGMDYKETFALVAKMTTVRTLITVASCFQWKISQLDVKNAFLNGDLNEEVYMTPPPGVPHQSGKVCKLRKALYGLKQAPHACYEKFSTVVTSLGFVSSHHDSTLFVKRSSAGRILLSLFVDDMIITGDDCNGIELLKAELSHRMTDNKITDIPLDGKYTPTDGDPLLDPSLYRTIVGSLVNLKLTRPYIAYDVHIFQTLLFPSTSSLDLRAYCDADWAGDSVTHKSTTRFCVFLRDSLISWKTKKQDVLSRSSIEAGYRAMAVTTSEIVWLRWLLADGCAYYYSYFIVL